MALKLPLPTSDGTLTKYCARHYGNTIQTSNGYHEPEYELQVQIEKNRSAFLKIT